MVATFVRSGYPEAQEVNIDLLFLFGTSQNLTGIDDELYGVCECTGCNSPILQNEFFGKDSEFNLQAIFKFVENRLNGEH